MAATGTERVGNVEGGVHALQHRQALDLPIAKVRDLHSRIEERFDQQRITLGGGDLRGELLCRHLQLEGFPLCPDLHSLSF
jgi:hypothetical protein